ncbi:MAG: restriction endonuclease [Candidatus Lambdaproteobacteria bacterium]|nr:restriction endonuclease [Candidatus Lambdaproteobacteria bacterium]
MNRDLYYGDNLDVLRNSIAAASVDLIYLDPPFNSKRDYNLLFRSPTGQESDAQITAFEDTWHWGEQASREYQQLLRQPNTDVAELIQAFEKFLHHNDVMAYLVMMANRLLELHRVLKPTGSVYLHCDPTASHYLKILLDAVFGKENFRNEIIWYYYNKYSAGTHSFAKNFDQILFYTKSHRHVFNPIRELRDQPIRQLVRENVGGVLKNRKDESGRVMYREVADMKVDAVWRIPCLQPASREMLGYPTQKPLALLERIIQASSNEGDVVLDPFCGCGTTVHAAEKLKRGWIGIDITHLAISLIEKRLKRAFPTNSFNVHGTPKDLDGARDLAWRDKDEFQKWACSLVGVQHYQGKKKGADSGIDGQFFIEDDNQGAKKIVVSVKGDEHVGVSMVRDLKAVLEREKAVIGLFVTLAPPTRPMVTEAATAGLYHSAGYNEDWSRVQILTIEGLLNGSERPIFKNMNPALGSRQAKRESNLRHRGNVEMALDE